MCTNIVSSQVSVSQDAKAPIHAGLQGRIRSWNAAIALQRNEVVLSVQRIEIAFNPG